MGRVSFHGEWAVRRSAAGTRVARVSTGSVSLGIRTVSPCSVSVMPAPRTLASRIARRENAAFVGRARELLIAETLFGPDAPASVLLVHGPGGIGKSVLLREIRRRGARRAGRRSRSTRATCRRCRTRVEQALAGAWDCERPLVLLDTYERMSALGALPARDAAAVAARRAP